MQTINFHTPIYLCIVVLLYMSNAKLNLKEVEELRNTTCYQIYSESLGNATTLDFESSIGGLKCPHKTWFHCLPLTDDMERNIQFCSDWIWIEAGKCPSLYSIQQAIQPYDCNKEIPGCPQNLYKSYTYYRYKRCFRDSAYDKIQEDENNTVTVDRVSMHNQDLEGKEDQASIAENTPGNGGKPWIAAIFISVVAIAILIAVVLYLRRRRDSKGPNASSNNEELGNMQAEANVASTNRENSDNEEEEEDIFLDTHEELQQEQQNPANEEKSEGKWFNFNLFSSFHW